MVYKIGVIGDRESVLGFMTVGFSVFVADNKEKAREELLAAAKQDFAVIFITEEYAIELKEDIDKFTSKPLPAIICIPSKAGSKGYGMNSIKESVENAVGADILFK